ncbi:MAG: hypothetical protein ACFFC7_17850 [Candidatus Hermodarchaeota archaeon]
MRDLPLAIASWTLLGSIFLFLYVPVGIGFWFWQTNGLTVLQDIGLLLYFEFLSCTPVVIGLLFGQFSIMRVIYEKYLTKSAESETKKMYTIIYSLFLYSMGALWSFITFLSSGFNPEGFTPIIANIGAFAALLLAMPVELRSFLKQRANFHKSSQETQE